MLILSTVTIIYDVKIIVSENTETLIYIFFWQKKSKISASRKLMLKVSLCDEANLTQYAFHKLSLKSYLPP